MSYSSMLSTPPTAPDKGSDEAAQTYPVIGLVCLLGIFIHLFFSSPVLTIIGFHYGDEDNSFFEKQHPGTYLIFLSFLMLLLRHGNPLGMLLRLYKSERIFTGFLALWTLILAYMIARSGAKGLSFLIDTQIISIMAALVLTRTPLSYCRAAAYIFIAFAVVNSIIGIGEGYLKQRIFTPDAVAGVDSEKVFRASAWLGHPLYDAVYTPMMLLIMLGLRLSKIIKCVAGLILGVSLVAFGGRTGLIVCCLGLCVLGVIGISRSWRRRRLSLFQILLLITGMIAIPAIFCLSLYGLVSSSLGERLFQESSFTDVSAVSRVLAWKVFDFMTPEEFIFGMAPSHTTDITERMRQSTGLYLIENPWILMFMNLGLIAFPIWFAATMALIWRLMRNNPLAIKLAVLAFFIIASGANSFGVKGSEYLMMVASVLCASRALMLPDARISRSTPG